MQEQDVDRGLVERASAGDAVATTVLLTRTHAKLHRFVAARIPRDLQSVVDADDVLQDTKIDAYRNLHRFELRGPDSFDRWIATIALRRLRNEIQRHRALKRGGGRIDVSVIPDVSIVAMLDLMAGPEKTPSCRAARGEALEAVSTALGLLPEHYRQAVQLVYLDGQSHEEAAKRMGRTPSAVHNMCHKAKRKLLDLLGSRSRFLSDS